MLLFLIKSRSLSRKHNFCNVTYQACQRVNRCIKKKPKKTVMSSQIIYMYTANVYVLYYSILNLRIDHYSYHSLKVLDSPLCVQFHIAEVRGCTPAGKGRQYRTVDRSGADLVTMASCDLQQLQLLK